MNRLSNVKDSLVGCDNVYKFTLRQLLVSRANIITLVIMVLFSVIAPPLLTVLSGSISETSFDSTSMTELSAEDGATDVYIVNKTPYAFDVSEYVKGVTVHT